MKERKYTVDHVRWFTRQTQAWSVILGVSVGLAMMVFSKPSGLGFLSGVALSILSVRLMSPDMPADHAAGPRSRTVLRAILGYAVLFGFLAFIAHSMPFDLVSAFAGLLFVQIILIIGRVYRGFRALGNMFRG